MMFLHSWHLFQIFKYNSIILNMSILRGDWNAIQWLPTDLHYILRFILFRFVLQQFLQGWIPVLFSSLLHHQNSCHVAQK